MLSFTARALAACASIACASLLAQTATAELPVHLNVQLLGPTGSDFGSAPAPISVERVSIAY